MIFSRLFPWMVLIAATTLCAPPARADTTTAPQPLRFRWGPRVRYLTPDQAAVSFQTHASVAAALEFGKSDRTMKRVEDPAPTTRHRLIAEGLEPGTAYAYRVRIGAGPTSRVSKTYTFDTTFNYTTPRLSKTASPYPNDAMAGVYAEAARHVLSSTGVTQGYCLVYGCGEGRLAYELAGASDLMIVGVDEDADSVAAARKRLRRAGAYGTKITVRHVASLAKLPITSHFANLVVSERLMISGGPVGSAAEVFRVLRPGGGVACLGQPGGGPNRIAKDALEQWFKATKIRPAIIDKGGALWASISRPALTGIGAWTHEYAEPGNTACSGDRLGGATRTTDLHVQWIGRPGADFGLDRNPRMPAPLSVNGRLFHQGLNRMIALDAYNGAVLWLLEIPDLRRVNMPRDAANWCADENRLYVAVADMCWVLDARTGELQRAYALPAPARPETHDWSYVARSGDKLFGSCVKKGAAYTNFWGKPSWYDKAGTGSKKVCSDRLFACAAQTGKPAWTYADGAIINSTIGIAGGRICFVESRHPDMKASKTGRIGSAKLWSDQFLVALDAETGKKRWERAIDTADGTLVFYLACTDQTIVIVSSTGGKYYLYAYSAADGSPRWQADHKWTGGDHSGHMQHPVIVGNGVYVEPCGYDLTTGKRLTDKMGRHEGCATYAAGADAMIYRGQARRIAMWDIKTGAMTNWTNLRPSCWLSVIPACGMVLAPEGGAGCSCGNWLETSVGFLPRSDEATH